MRWLLAMLGLLVLILSLGCVTLGVLWWRTGGDDPEVSALQTQTERLERQLTQEADDSTDTRSSSSSSSNSSESNEHSHNSTYEHAQGQTNTHSSTDGNNQAGGSTAGTRNHPLRS